MRKNLALLAWGWSFGIFLLVVSFPCVAVVAAGKREGFLNPGFIVVGMIGFFRMALTNAFFLTRPISRSRWFWTRWVSSIVWLASLLAVSFSLAQAFLLAPEGPAHGWTAAGLGYVFASFVLVLSLGVLAGSLVTAWSRGGKRVFLSLPILGVVSISEFAS